MRAFVTLPPPPVGVSVSDSGHTGCSELACSKCSINTPMNTWVTSATSFRVNRYFYGIFCNYITYCHMDVSPFTLAKSLWRVVEIINAQLSR